jgi:hypothetical protein
MFVARCGRLPGHGILFGVNSTPGVALVKLLVVNVARAPGRRSAMEAKLRAIGQSFEILEATDGVVSTRSSARWLILGAAAGSRATR